MAWRYRKPTYTPCEKCGWWKNGKCTIPDEIYEYECPNYNDPEPEYIPEEIEV